MKSSAHLVHAAVSMHVGLDAHAIEPSQRLGHDLGLDAFDLVLVALRLEELEPSRGEFPMELLESVRTVRDLTALYDAWLEGDDRPTIPSGFAPLDLEPEQQRESVA